MKSMKIKKNKKCRLPVPPIPCDYEQWDYWQDNPKYCAKTEDKFYSIYKSYKHGCSANFIRKEYYLTKKHFSCIMKYIGGSKFLIS